MKIQWEGLVKLRGPNDASPGVQLVVTSFLSQTYAMLSGVCLNPLYVAKQ
jgi:hypothetical protein